MVGLFQPYLTILGGRLGVRGDDATYRSGEHLNPGTTASAHREASLCTQAALQEAWSSSSAFVTLYGHSGGRLVTHRHVQP